MTRKHRDEIRADDTFPVTDEIRDTDPLQIIDVPPPDQSIDVTRPEEKLPELDIDSPPPPELVDAVVRYFNVQRATLLNRVADLETLLGFMTEAPDDSPLAVRVAKLEKFCNLKG